MASTIASRIVFVGLSLVQLILYSIVIIALAVMMWQALRIVFYGVMALGQWLGTIF